MSFVNDDGDLLITNDECQPYGSTVGESAELGDGQPSQKNPSQRLDSDSVRNTSRGWVDQAAFTTSTDSVTFQATTILPQVPRELDTVQSSNSTESSCFVWLLSFFAALGGFLFGYDTGVISGAMLLLHRNFDLSFVMQEIIVSITIGFAFLSSLICGFLIDACGRKLTTLIASTVFTVGSLVLSLAQDISMLVCGRAIVGVGIGFASTTVPIYIAECAPPHLRGRLVTINNLFITGGQLSASLIDAFFSGDEQNGWRYMLGLAIVPSVIQFIGFIFLPKSPRWLISKNQEVEAKRVLERIRGSPNIEDEFLQIKSSHEEAKRHAEKLSGWLNITKILRNQPVRRALIVGCGLQLFQQLSGINTVMYYSATIIQMAGISDNKTAIWLAAGTAAVNFVFTLVGVYLVEKIGRRKLTLFSLTGVLFSLIVLAVAFQITALNSPSVAFGNGSSSNSSCAMYSSCNYCISNKECGFCYTESAKRILNGSCLPTTVKSNTHSLTGACREKSLPEDVYWAYNFCPSSYSWLALLGLVLYLMCFAPGMGPMPWTVNSEIYPLWARGTGNSLATATNWISNLLVSMTFLTLTETITKYGTYWLFAGIVVIGILFIACLLPETRGHRLEEVEELFSGPLFVFNRNQRKYLNLDTEGSE